MKKNLMKGITGVALELNLCDIIALQDTIVANLAKRARFQTILNAFKEWQNEARFTQEDGKEVNLSNLDYKQRRTEVDHYFRQYWPKDVANLGYESDSQVSGSGFRQFVRNPFDAKQLDMLYTFLKKLDTGCDCQSTIFDEED